LELVLQLLLELLLERRLLALALLLQGVGVTVRGSGRVRRVSAWCVGCRVLLLERLLLRLLALALLQGVGVQPTPLHRTPYTVHPAPYTLHPTPYTLHPTPCTLTPHPLQQPRGVGLLELLLERRLLRLLSLDLQRFREGLAFKAHRPLYHSTLGSRVIKKEKISSAAVGCGKYGAGVWQSAASACVVCGVGCRA